MRFRTHVVFSIGLTALIESALGISNIILLLGSSLVLSYLINFLIDALGHEEKNGFTHRSPRTHTMSRSFTLGLIISLLVALFLYYMTPIGAYNALIIVLMGPLTGWSHMLLDALTEGGIYIRRNGRWVRFALAHFKYNNTVLNWLFTIIGILLLIKSLVT
ncbi:DUF1286 domain-containing protein [Caldivirga maquilingensis]|uniref:Membrane-bound metal-dependent hydrolase n=1 Tax=Caldivirga maquilingensis (strain ATCC 700844 / DSM 13496 / JCM 10307 / IC-167) TaxID=397948 RepID=A8MAZ4_CALMQ|nr:DUF1286 domain-containing protein [Caldivirga maquilingensis]ABW02623.1 conserved hypothetical protein [Caldivirga maquilingensis IC-167]